MLIDIPRGPDGVRGTPGTWARLLMHTPDPEFRPYWTAVVYCPSCGRPLLASLHTIAENGQISPSLGHPTQYPPCEWHVNPRLLDWTPGDWPLPAQRPLETCARCGTQARNIGGWGTWGNPGIICGSCRAVLAASLEKK